VKKGDTLMKIAFEVFGDVYRWREILNQNRDQVSGLGQLKPGTVLNIGAEGYVVIERNGKPYLIRWGDTLIKISDSLYGTPFKWRKLWKNNLRLIHDPNKIYAGFTLYYAMTSEEEAEAQRLRSTPRGPASVNTPKK
jgi:nucleoid-associated protein YgaU